MAQLNQKTVKVLGKLIEAGFTDEKVILSMTVEDILKLPNISVTEIGIINGLQKAIKSNKVISFFSGEEQHG